MRHCKILYLCIERVFFLLLCFRNIWSFLEALGKEHIDPVHLFSFSIFIVFLPVTFGDLRGAVQDII